MKILVTMEIEEEIENKLKEMGELSAEGIENIIDQQLLDFATVKKVLISGRKINIDMTAVLKAAKKQFLDDDGEEPFANREYVEKTTEYFDALIPLEEGLGDFPEIDKRALYDIVSDIKRTIEQDPDKYLQVREDEEKHDH